MSYPKGYVDQYQKTAVTSASPLQLVIMLYDGALRFIDEAERALQSKDRYVRNEKIQKAQRIVAELTASLDTQRGGEIATNLTALYNFVYGQLVESNLNETPDGLRAARQVLSELRTSWVELEKQMRNGATEEPPESVQIPA